MHSSHIRLIAASALALALTIAAPGASLAQRTKDDGTGGAAGYSPPVDMPGGAAPTPDAAPMNTPPTPPPDDSASQGAPEPEPVAPNDGTKKDDGTPPSDAPTGPDQPD